MRMPHREIVAAANDYLATHRNELIAEAKQIVERLQAEGFFGKRCANIKTFDQRAKALIPKGFRCAKLMNEMEFENDCRLCTGIH